ncbi:sensor histidine kinase [Endothiovibrio diazotrophicus]
MESREVLSGVDLECLLSAVESHSVPPAEALEGRGFLPVAESVYEVMHEASELLARWAKGKGVSYGVEISPGVGRWMVVDRTLLLWSLTCLAVNGVQRTARGEVVVGVSLGVRSGWLRFYVRDSGGGMAPERMNALLCGRGDVGEDAGRFLLCRRLVARMEGVVRGESRRGAGSTFVLEIPADGGSRRPRLAAE